MNIDLCVEAFSPNLTGVGRYTLEILKGLQGHSDVSALRTFYNGSPLTHPERLLDAGFRLNPVQRKLRSKLYKYTEAAFYKKRIFHGPNFMLPRNVEQGIVTVHDLSVYKFPDTHPPERIAHFEREFASSIDRAQHIITDSETTRLEVLEFTGVAESKVTAIHLGVGSAYSPMCSVEGAGALASFDLTAGKYILLVATFEPRKKIDAALEAYSELPEQTKREYPLVLVGAKGWKNEALHVRVAHDERHGNIRFLGFVPEEILPVLYSGARLFLYPSIYEGFGLPTIEAMASGVPVIVSNRSCLPEVTQGAAMMIDPDDTIQFSLAIQRGLEDEAWRTRAIAHGLEVASEYTWSKCIGKTVDVYRHL